MLIEQEISCDTWILRATKRKIHPKGRDAPVPTGANGVNHVRFADNPLGYQQNVTSLRQQPPWLLSQSEFCTCLVQNSGSRATVPVAAPQEGKQDACPTIKKIRVTLLVGGRRVSGVSSCLRTPYLSACHACGVVSSPSNDGRVVNNSPSRLVNHLEADPSI